MSNLPPRLQPRHRPTTAPADTYTTTPYAVGISRDAEWIHSGDTEEEALALALAEHLEQAECEGFDVLDSLEIEVYRDAGWCTGPTKKDDCSCGGGHENWGHGYRWLLVEWESKERRFISWRTP